MKRCLQAAAAVLVCATALPASATTVRRMANDELTAQADVIVIGRVTSSKTVWADRNLYTVVTVEVNETLKGAAVSSVEVALPGGIDSRRKFPISITYPGAPTLDAHERVVLFLVGGQEVNAYAIAGFTQGKFSIVEDAQGVQRVSRDLTRVQVQDATGLARGTRTFQRLTELIDEIRGQLSQGR